MKLKSVLSIAFFGIVNAVSKRRPDRVLMVGNSFTAQNGMCEMLERVAKTANINLRCTESIRYGSTLGGHLYFSDTINNILGKKWDYVFLQEQSNRLSDPHYSARWAHSLQFIVKFDRLLKPRTRKIILFQTWGYKIGDPFVRNDNYYKMQKRLENGYEEAYDLITENARDISRVGTAWRRAYPILKNRLYRGDGKHPDILGTYLATCVHFRTLYNRPVPGKYRPKGVTKKQQKIILKICNSLQV